ncbi:MAG: GTP pyrophosphokinase family protein [Oscillospiraceae bacterium]|jgi:putative GTP pyrophosphokinase|nr:GTP pyrophosphokinase family protein [Oscillospiraceae bacterium]
MNGTETDLTEEIGRALGISLPAGEAAEWLKEYAEPYRELMTRYRCAMMEVETKFRVLNEELSLGDDRNPIETVKVRLKKPESIMKKLLRNGFPMTVESIEQNINDIAGVRVICSFSSDIYMLADSLLKQDDVLLLQKKDYIAEPKSNGYRSLHLIIATPIFLHNSKRLMKVEVQLRTLAMDMWASLEHKLRYKKNAESAAMAEELLACAEISAEIDRRMEKIRSDVAAAG